MPEQHPGSGNDAASDPIDFSPTDDSPAETVFPNRDWSEATPASQGVDEGELKAAVAYMDGCFGPEGARELIVIRNGCLIWSGLNID